MFDEAKSVLEDAGYRVVRSGLADPSALIEVNFTGELRFDQREAVEAILGHDTGVLVAPPGSGKTVIACALIAERKVSTAILINSAELLVQWRERLQQFLTLTDKQIGQLGAGRRKRRGVVDLIMMQSVSHRNADSKLLQEYGQIIIDECHAVAAPATEAALRGVNVAQWVGLTATPYRADQMNGLITMQCGPIRHTTSSVNETERQLVVHETNFTTGESGTDGPSIQAIYTELASNTERNELIVRDVIGAASQGRTSLVLTNRLDHLDVLAAEIGHRVPVPVVQLHGRMTKAERREVRKTLSIADGANEPFVLVAIDKVAGEGLDLPTLNTLFLTVPVSFKGRVIQQIGRITRGRETADTVPAIVHDYCDSNVPLLDRMHSRRRRVMTKEGFTILNE
ncbi:hypothetical protein BH09ACT6_BH09ACT6_03980 [soil metagenome]